MESVQEQLFSKAKWFFIIDFIPLSAEKKLAIGKKWHREDWERPGIAIPTCSGECI
jgi:hypothetical protein